MRQAITRDLVTAGSDVRAYDPAVTALDGTVWCADEADSSGGDALVLTVDGATAGALMSPVPGNGLRTPQPASGPGDSRFAGVLVRWVPPQPRSSGNWMRAMLEELNVSPGLLRRAATGFTPTLDHDDRINEP